MHVSVTKKKKEDACYKLTTQHDTDDDDIDNGLVLLHSLKFGISSTKLITRSCKLRQFRIMIIIYDYSTVVLLVTG